MINIPRKQSFIYQYLTYCSETRKLAKSTIALYSKTLIDYFLWCMPQINAQWEDKITLETYIHHLKTKYSVSTMKRKVSIFRAFFRYLADIGEVTPNPFLTVNITYDGREYRLLSLFTNMLKNVRRDIDNSVETAYRDMAILKIMIDTKMHPKEIINLKAVDIDFSKNTIAGRHVNKLVIKSLLDYIVLAKPLTYLFIDSEGGHITENNINDMVSKYSDNHLDSDMIRTVLDYPANLIDAVLRS